VSIGFSGYLLMIDFMPVIMVLSSSVAFYRFNIVLKDR